MILSENTHDYLKKFKKNKKILLFISSSSVDELYMFIDESQIYCYYFTSLLQSKYYTSTCKQGLLK